MKGSKEITVVEGVFFLKCFSTGSFGKCTFVIRVILR